METFKDGVNQYRQAKKEFPEMFCLIDGNKGIYIPKVFAQRWGNSCVKGINQEDIDTLCAGPDHHQYWDVWDECIDQIEFLFEGALHTLFERGDLFAVPVN
jgi:hypothetical protein